MFSVVSIGHLHFDYISDKTSIIGGAIYIVDLGRSQVGIPVHLTNSESMKSPVALVSTKAFASSSSMVSDDQRRIRSVIAIGFGSRELIMSRG